MRYTKRNMALKRTRVSKQLKVAAGLALFASLCSATGSLATVTSGDPFSVDGVVLASPGVASWPVITNDEVSTTTAGALLTFRDGSAVKLDPQSRVKLAGTESAPEVILIAGNLQAKLAPGSRLLVTRVDTDKDKDTGSNTTPTVEPASTGATRPNNNNNFRKLVFLGFASGVSLAGLGLATDAVLQPAAASPR